MGHGAGRSAGASPGRGPSELVGLELKPLKVSESRTGLNTLMFFLAPFPSLSDCRHAQEIKDAPRETKDTALQSM